jgi:hypothetical protein
MGVSITLYVEPTTLASTIEVLELLEPLPFDNNLEYDTSRLMFDTRVNSNWVQISVPMDRYLKFKNSLAKNRK